MGSYDFEKGRLKFIHGGRYPHSHSLFIDDRKRAIIDPASKRELLESINEQRPVDILINSHGHEDHLLYNYLFQEAQFWVHPADAHTFENVENLIACYGEMDEEAKRGWREFLLNECHYVSRKADRFLQDGEEVDFGQVRMEVIHTPGHTPGHCAFYFPNERVLFLGDLDLVKAGPYYGDVCSSIEETIASLERLKSYPCEVYLTSHGRGIYEADPEYIERYKACITRREEELIEFLSERPRTLEEITERGIIYGAKRALGGIWDLSLSERSMMEKHIQSLKRRGLVRKEGDYFILDSNGK